MKQNYEIELKENGNGGVVTLFSRSTLYNANRAFDALRVFLHGSAIYGSVDLYVTGKDTRYRLNGAKIKGVDNGL